MIVTTALWPMNGSQLSFQILASPETNDFEVRIYVDSEDVINKYHNDLMGLDPDELRPAIMDVPQNNEVKNMLVARCQCGESGCDSWQIQVSKTEDKIKWLFEAGPSKKEIFFNYGDYIKAIEAMAANTSWETPERTASRLLHSKLDHQLLSKHSLKYKWGSGRIKAGKFAVSLELSPGPYQILVYFDWPDDSDIDTLMDHICRELSRKPDEWQEVYWSPLGFEYTAKPEIAGLHWKKIE